MNTLPKRGFLRCKEVLDEYPPVFIIGPPRSGTTMLFQLLAQSINCVYINNLMALLPCWMVALSKVGNMQSKDFKESDFGFVPGILSPNEAGPIFRYWFEDNSALKREAVKTVVAKLSDKHGAYFLSKNLFNVFRIEAILETFPNAKFIVSRRNYNFLAQSIYLARIKQSKNKKDNWFSVRPPGYEKMLSLPVIDQIIWQIEQVELQTQRLYKSSNVSNFLEVRYEDMCSQPKVMLNTMSKFVGGKLLGDLTRVPKLRNEIRVSSDVWKELEKQIEKSYILS